MPFLSRRAPQPLTAPDPEFPFWDTPTAEHFRSLVRTAFSEVGREVEVFAGHVRGAERNEFGLANLAASCHQDKRGRRAWPKVIRSHVRAITASVDAPSAFDGLTSQQVLESTYCRVMPTEDVYANMTYARAIAPGLSEVLNLDLPTSVAYFTDERVEAYGLSALREAGLENLRRVPIEQHDRLEVKDGRIEFLLGESMFTASSLLVLPDLFARLGLTVDPENGVLVGIPYRHQLAFHIPRDASVLPSLQMLARFTVSGFRDMPGQVSSSVFWWRREQIDVVGRLGDDGIRMEAGPEFAEMLARITSG